MTVIGSQYCGTQEYSDVRQALITAARRKGTVFYMEVGRILGITEPGNHLQRQVGQVLGEISEDEVAQERPMLSAVAVNQRGKPGPGFYDLAWKLGKLGDPSQRGHENFWQEELRRVYHCWSAIEGE